MNHEYSIGLVSTVTIKYVTFSTANVNILNIIDKIDDASIAKSPELVLCKQKLNLICENINTILDQYLFEMKPILRNGFTPIISIDWNGRIYDLNIDSQSDFEIALLLNIVSIVNETISKNGCIYIYNKSILMLDKYGTVFSILRVKNRLLVDELYRVIVENNENDLPIISSYDFLLDVIDNYINYGLLEYDNEGRINRTPKGYLISLIS